MMNQSPSSRIVGAFVFPEFWENSSCVPSSLVTLRDFGVNAIMTETDSYDFSAIEATHNSGLRFYAGVACFSDHAANSTPSKSAQCSGQSWRTASADRKWNGT
jgi:hypothetical protein